jgi:hypothetical protein
MITQSLQFNVIGRGSVNFGFLNVLPQIPFVVQLPGTEFLTLHQCGVDGFLTGEPSLAYAITSLNDGNGQAVPGGRIRFGDASDPAAFAPTQGTSYDFQGLFGSKCPI